jgi:guanyl-specific ribonuclease Sa
VGLNYSEYVNQTESYAVVGHPVLDGAPTTEVISNATLLAVSNGKVAARVTENNAVWMASNGTLLRSDENGTVRTGAAIGAPDELITPFVLGGPFTYAVDILSMNSTLVKEMTNSTVSVGSTKMAATSWGQTTALASSFVIFGFGYTFSVVVGVAQGASFYVPVSVSVIGPPLLVGFQSADTSTVVTLVSIARA